ncbi:hypothetical protein DCAR_0933352 [Daucus carota subsp. sativus]|uniref:Uncharacterized protein n=1 Tax=Daucus carota subsp. sativus TaxID=79200 RepID=A0A175YDM9_DAUCS|nr:PREDICTED: uncharacterized protein LOC108202205 [Daucus carota subsp. sativus]WOH13841.1 hypothetical protein DCAR_0933352 [Daucus carota subsp. sativus]
MFQLEKSGTGSPQERRSSSSATINFVDPEFEGCDETEDFAFEFNERLDIHSRTADELFDGGKIKLLQQQQPKMHEHFNGVCVETTRRDDMLLEGNDDRRGRGRGRERVYYSSSSRRQIFSRSLSPVRSSTRAIELGHDEKCCSKNSSFLSSSSSSNSSNWYGRWKLTDILLFRNSSDGYAINRKYEKLKKMRSRNEDLSKNSSLGSNRTACVSMLNKKKKVGGDEWQHYKVYQAAAEEMRRKTFLPYRRNIISCMDMDSSVF